MMGGRLYYGHWRAERSPRRMMGEVLYYYIIDSSEIYHYHVHDMLFNDSQSYHYLAVM